MMKNDVVQLLEEKHIKPSLHRIKILEYLMVHRNHPNVDMIYKAIGKEIPTLSKTTIYNTLKIFQESGIVQFLTVEENEVRFDATMQHHAHFRCVTCGAVHDIELSSKVFEMESVDGHRITGSQIYFFGHCRDCSQLRVIS
ncbi:MAG TPA: Fur family transcriptional regulator [Spirochaetota bacterium]|nr:Fur family transcriptional regulator [Spirochaetota bacterium]HNT09874.1 Fur family transcriptional regulator [Spirochaetota bacterium]HNV46283.1 Fur family transcriptional regulator [Spirochaetota bacterium]HPI23188.1 Fur family transcriptional regulator [Spirochaetota bacterium]HPU87129.1 Fur family transcriptional regulator [Spirochaetota bacterium]